MNSGTERDMDNQFKSGVLTESGVAGLTGAQSRAAYERQGYLSVERALDPAFCQQSIGSLANASLIRVESSDRRGTTKFMTLNGEELLERVPRLRDLALEFADIVSRLAGTTYVPLDNSKVGISLNYTPPGGAFVRHFDRNEITVSLYLNEVANGELTIWPNIVTPFLDRFGRYRLPLALWKTRVTGSIDIPPRIGTAVVFSRRTVHAVSPVTGERCRVSIILAYDRPGRSFMDVPDYYGQGHSRAVLEQVRA